MTPEIKQALMSADPYAHHLLDKPVRPLLRAYVRAVLETMALTLIPIWIAMPFFWGCLYSMPSHMNGLDAMVVNHDQNGLVGTGIVDSLIRQNSLPPQMHLTYFVTDPSEYRTNQEVENAIASEKAWVSIIVSQQLTKRLDTAWDNGDATWDPRQAMTVVYNSGRHSDATRSILLPLVQQALSEAVRATASQALQDYLQRRGNTLSQLVNAPNTITTPLSWNMHDVRPADASAAQATTFVGLIYVLILAFIFVIRVSFSKGWYGSKLKLRSYLLVRLLAPAIYYFFIAWAFSLLSLAFRVPFSRRIRGGFLAYWAIVWYGMIILGGLMELVASLVGLPYTAFFMVSFIVINNSVSLCPFEVLHPFFRFGYAMPFFNLRQAFLTLIFNTKSHMGRNLGVLAAWLVVIYSGLFALTIWERRRANTGPGSTGPRGKDLEKGNSA